MGDISMCTFQHCLDDCKASGSASTYAPACFDASWTTLEPWVRACAADDGCRDFWLCTFEKNCLVGSGSGEPPDAAHGETVNKNPACFWECIDRTHSYEPRQTADGGVAPSVINDFALNAFFNAYQNCRFGDLSCVGRYQSLRVNPSKANIDVTVFVNSGSYAEYPGPSLEGIEVRACRQGITPCRRAADFAPAATTDETGHATFHLPNDPAGGSWYFEVTPGWSTGPSRVLFATGRRLAADTTLSLPVPQELAKRGQPSFYYSIAGQGSKASGGVLAWTRSCDAFVATGLEVRINGPREPGSGAAYFAPDFQAFPEPSTNTLGAYLEGVEPGVRTVTAWKGDSKVAEEQVVVEADAVTVMSWLEPLRAPGPGM